MKKKSFIFKPQTKSVDLTLCASRDSLVAHTLLITSDCPRTSEIEIISVLDPLTLLSNWTHLQCVLFHTVYGFDRISPFELTNEANMARCTFKASRLSNGKPPSGRSAISLRGFYTYSYFSSVFSRFAPFVYIDYLYMSFVFDHSHFPFFHSEYKFPL